MKKETGKMSEQGKIHSAEELKRQILACLCSAVDIDRAINDTLAIVGEYFNVDRAYIFENFDDDRFCRNTFEWCNKGIEPEISKLQSLSYKDDLDGKWYDNFNKDDIFFCPNINDLPTGQQIVLKPQHITGMLQCAIRVKGKFTGYIGFDNCSRENKGWETDKDAIDALLFISHLLTLYLLDYRRDKKQLDEKELKVKQANILFDDLLKNISCGVAVYNYSEDGKLSVEYINDGLAAILGTDKENLRQKAKNNTTVTIKKEYVGKVMDAFDRIIGGKKSETLIFRCDALDGREPWILLKLSASVTTRDNRRFYGTYSDISEEIAVQEKLRQSVDITKAALKSASMVVWEYDIEKNEVTRVGVSNSDEIAFDVPGRFIKKGILYPQYEERYTKLFSDVKSAEEAVSGDFLMHNSINGADVWQRIILTPVKKNGKVVSAIGTSLDVTARKENENKYYKLVDSLSALDKENLIATGIYNLSKNSVVSYNGLSGISSEINTEDTYEENVELFLKTVVSEAQREFVQGKMDRNKLLSDYVNEFRRGKFEFMRYTETDNVLWALMRYTLFQEPNSGDIILFIYSYDISERMTEKKILDKLSATEYEILGLIDVKTRTFTIRSLIHSVGKPDYAQHGSFQETIDKRIDEFVVDAEKYAVRRQFDFDTILRELENSKIYQFSFSVNDESGDVLRKSYQLTYLDESKSAVLFWRTDITSLYNREQHQLSETEAALRSAKEASSSKTEFFSRMSHDMRTPMNGILGMVNLSRDETDIAVLKENIEKIGSSGQYLLGLINDTLDFQKIESGKMALEEQIVYTADLVENILDMIKVSAKDKGVKLVFDSGNADLEWYVRTDPLRMKQIFINLLSNAVKFTPSGGTVEFSFKLLYREGMISHDVISVRDTGVGMSSDFMKNGIFRPFSQESNEVSSVYAGSGLGLSIAKSLVSLMGGRIEVESQLGEGTTFKVYLDFERVSKSEAQGIIEKKKLHSEDLSSSLRGKRILLAEDHPLNAEIARKLLVKAGCEVTWAKDGSEAVKVFEASQENFFDAVLMDIRMPVMDGLCAARAIRSLDRGDAGNVPIIAMTANAYEEDVKEALSAGMNEHLAKPVETEKLYGVLARLTTRNQ